MLRNKRINLIRDYVYKNNTVSIDDLVTEFNVSKNTIRRDIQLLVENGELKKVYGGVAANHSTYGANPNEVVKNNEKKENLIAKSAANFVEDGDIIYIDSEATTMDMFPFLKTKKLTVVTNSLDFILRSLPYDNLNVISIGGMLDRKSRSFTVLKGSLQIGYNINKAFMAPAGISITNGATHSSPLENELKQSIVERSLEVYVLVDYYKFDKYALMTYSSLDKIDYIITDHSPDEKYINFAKNNGIQLVVVE